MEEKEKPDIKVTDKRKFDSSGERRSDAPEEEPKENVSKEAAAEHSTSSGVGGDHSAERSSGSINDPGDPQELTFIAFILSLATQAMVGLGVIADPRTQQPAPNLEVARQMIDIIAMLRTKTKGNLEADELTTIDNILFDLRQNYLQISQQGTDGIES